MTRGTDFPPSRTRRRKGCFSPKPRTRGQAVCFKHAAVARHPRRHDQGRRLRSFAATDHQTALQRKEQAMEVRCAIWNTPAIVRPTKRDGRDLTSSRAGGRYFISGMAEIMIANFARQEKALLTTWLVDQRRAGEECPEITSNILDLIKSRARLKFSAKVERFFQYVSIRITRLGGRLILWPPSGSTSGQEAAVTHDELCAWTESTDDGKLIELARLLCEQGLLLPDPSGQYALTARGYQRLEEVEQGRLPSVRGFVAMWFDKSMESAYQDGVEPAIRAAGYEPVRIDQKEHVNKIDDEIIAEIRRSRFVVADFTCGISRLDKRDTAVPRGGVYYEAGFTQGLDIPVF